jgi:uncharacterized protein (TIGR00288 family)
MSENSELMALLIDGDNANSAHVPMILNKISEYGEPIIMRVYLNKSSLTQSTWDEAINKYSLEPVYVPNNTPRKNAVDIALVIDAMELLYERPDLTRFCIVSSDSDFTRLAKRVKGRNKYILGVGREQTPASFVNACLTPGSDFVYIEGLVQSQVPVEQPENISDQANGHPDASDVTPLFARLFIQAYENTAHNVDDWVELVKIKEGMNALDPEFQARNTRWLAEAVKILAESYPNGVIEIDERLDNKPVMHYIRVNDPDLFRFVEVHKQAPEKKRGGWVLLSMIGPELKKYPEYENGFSYHGVKKKSLLKFVEAMEQDYPKVIKIKKENGAHLVRIKG